MAPDRSQWHGLKRHEGGGPDPQQGEHLQVDATILPKVEAPGCNTGLHMTTGPACPLTPNADSTIEVQSTKARGAGKRASSAPPMSCAVSPYHYSPLSKGHIRLLRLMPHRDGDSLIQCYLFNYPLLDSGEGTHPYEALSYAWGSSEKTRFISVNNCYLRITANLHAALLRLRDRFLERIMWVDAICIDQEHLEERIHQVRFMVMVFAKAGRVIVWLGEAEANSEQALEGIHRAADKQSTKTDQKNQHAVLTLLQRPWFRRIWVLQEVAAAQHLLVMCGSIGIDGHAFCSGLTSLEVSYEAHPELESLIRPAIYLIRRTIFQPKDVSSKPGTLSLNIRPLGELIDMYHTREASDRRDKVYALLGMSSDDLSGRRISLSYKILWKDLFRQLVKSLLSEQASVVTWDDEEIAVIESKGHVLAKVFAVGKDTTGDDKQYVKIASRIGSSGQEREWSARWTLQTFAKSIQKGDLVCLLQGASKPTIIRPHKDYCAVIAIAVTPIDEQPGRVDIDWPSALELRNPPRDFLLVWDWEKSHGRQDDGEDYDCFINNRVPKHVRTKSENLADKAARLQNTRLLISDSKEYKEPAKELEQTIEEMRNMMKGVMDEVDAARQAMITNNQKLLAALENFPLKKETGGVKE